MQSFSPGPLKEAQQEVVDDLCAAFIKLRAPLNSTLGSQFTEVLDPEFAEIRDRHRAFCPPGSAAIVGQDKKIFAAHLTGLVDSVLTRSVGINNAPRILPGERITGDNRPRNIRVMDIRGWLDEGKLKLAGLVQLRDNNHSSYYFDHTGYFPLSQGEIFMHFAAPSPEAVAKANENLGSFALYFVPLYTQKAFDQEVSLLLKYSKDMFKQGWHPLLSCRVINSMFSQAVAQSSDGSTAKPVNIMIKHRKTQQGCSPFLSIEYETSAPSQPARQFLDLKVQLSDRTIRVAMGNSYWKD